MFAFWRKKLKKISNNQSMNNNYQEQQDIIMMQSDSLGMTVVEENFDKDEKMQSLTPQQWVDIISQGKMDGYPYIKIYFSFLKGLPDYLRMKIWLFLMKNKVQQENKNVLSKSQKQVENPRISKQIIKEVSVSQYRQISEKKPQKQQYEQIQKDIHRSFSGKQKHHYTEPLLRKILYALSNWGISYSQGMNYILLNVIIYCLESLNLNQKSFQQLNYEVEKDIFIIIAGIILQMQQTFGNNNIFKVMAHLEEKIAENSPQILFLIYQLGMDCFSCFSQNYYSVMSYGDPPQQMVKYMMDLFFLEGQKAISSMIVRMLQIAHDEILKIKDPQALQKFMKRDIFYYCYKTLKEQQTNALKIGDFGMSFYKDCQQF